MAAVQQLSRRLIKAYSRRCLGALSGLLLVAAIFHSIRRHSAGDLGQTRAC
jgi:hypothetical protein